MNVKGLSLPLSIVFLIGVLVINAPNAAYSATSSCEASLEGSQEVPSVETDGNGTATMEFDASNNDVSWTVEFSGLSGPATAAHFHGPAAEGDNAGVQVNIGDLSGLSSPMEGSTELTPEQASWLLEGQLYINVHTADNPNGEVRGQVSCESGGPSDETKQTTSVVAGGEEFEIKYTISGGTLDSLTANPDIQTLTLNISSTSDGNLTLWLPTDLIDAEEDYAVFMDGEYGNFVVDELNATDDSRVLSIGFVEGAQVIEIVGTSMTGAEEPEPGRQTISVQIGSQTYDIPYEITGGSVQVVSADLNSSSLMVTMSSNSSGVLTLWLPTKVIDADDGFTVSIDGQAANFTELDRTSDSRVLKVEFEAGAQEINIAGTSIVPEFGTLAILLTSALTVGAVVATKRFSKFNKL